LAWETSAKQTEVLPEGDRWVIWSELATLAATLGQALLKSLNRIGQGAR
jgi:hypothetical protein